MKDYTELWANFLAGKPLGPVTQAGLRNLLDRSRSAILAAGRIPTIATPPAARIVGQTEAKALLTTARAELDAAGAKRISAATAARTVSHKPAAAKPGSDPRYTAAAPPAKKRGAVHRVNVIPRQSKIRKSILSKSHKL